MTTLSSPALSGIVGLLLLPRLDTDGNVRASAFHDLDALAARWGLASARHIATRHIERWMLDGKLPDWAAVPLLRLFGTMDLDGLWKSDDAAEHAGAAGELDASCPQRRWDLRDAGKALAGLLVEDVDVFCARVRLAGGAAGVGMPGAAWEHFISRQPADSQAGEDGVCVQPLAGVEAAGSRSSSAGPTSMTGIAVHSRVAFLIKPPPSLLATGLPVHLYLFHDVRTYCDRTFVPLLPLPPAAGFTPAALPTRAALLTHPVQPDGTNCFVVPARWGPIRHVVGVASTRPFGQSLLHDATRQWTISASRLDLLACRLQDRDRWRPGSYALMRGTYAVQGHDGAP